jgi:hypothetical protein
MRGRRRLHLVAADAALLRGEAPRRLKEDCTMTKSIVVMCAASFPLGQIVATRLIAAAPELLDALQELVQRDRAEAAESGFTDDEMTWLEDARRAIAKAKS